MNEWMNYFVVEDDEVDSKEELVMNDMKVMAAVPNNWISLNIFC